MERKLLGMLEWRAAMPTAKPGLLRPPHRAGARFSYSWWWQPRGRRTYAFEHTGLTYA